MVSKWWRMLTSQDHYFFGGKVFGSCLIVIGQVHGNVETFVQTTFLLMVQDLQASLSSIRMNCWIFVLHHWASRLSDKFIAKILLLLCLFSNCLSKNFKKFSYCCNRVVPDSYSFKVCGSLMWWDYICMCSFFGCCNWKGTGHWIDWKRHLISPCSKCFALFPKCLDS